MASKKDEHTIKKIEFSKMSLREKIAQMVMVSGNNMDSRFSKIGIGGRLVGRFPSEEHFKKTIKKYKTESKIEPFIAADLEGYWNPFESFYKSKFFSGVRNSKEAHELGKEHGKILKKFEFNLNFSPVVEVRNNVWSGRSFRGSLDDVKEKIKSYIRGLQKGGIIATAKHYPGGSMIRDPHKF